MLTKSGLFLCLLFVLQVSGLYKNVVQNPEFFENIIGNQLHQESRNLESSASRIVSGWEAQPGQHPHHANLRLVNQAGAVRQCGGSVVSRDWIITGSSCTINRINAVIRAGVVHLSHPEYISESTELYTHRNYNQNNHRNNIALVKLQQPVVYTKNLKAIRVQSRRNAYANYNGLLVYTSGHGMTWTSGSTSEVLRWVYLRAMANFNCQFQWYFSSVFDTTICARSYNVSSQSICDGDNGGPLVHVGNDGIPTLIGVASFRGSNCHNNAPSGFTRTGPYLTWFEQVTGIDFENLQEEEETTTSTTTEYISSSTTSTPSTSPSTTPYTFSTTRYTSTTSTPQFSSTSTPSTSLSTTPYPSPSPPVDTTSTTVTTPHISTTAELTTTTTPVPICTSTPTPILTTTELGDQEDDTEQPDDSDESDDSSSEYEEVKPIPEDSEENEEEGSNSEEDDELGQLLKRLEVIVKVKVKLSKSKIQKEVAKAKHHLD